ncbi:MAG: bifunctional glutamate N-acetyltransferase/amino-acid acetyltransferase ArgJ [Candidatus Omnitrophota bacterium]
MKEITSSITAAKGFKALGLHCGIKKKKKDLGVIYSESPAKCEAFFTTNALISAHIQIDKQYLKKSSHIRAIIVNSGNANCCTGENGLNDCLSMAGETAKVFGIRQEEVLAASTGVIGRRMPIEKIRKAILKFPSLIDEKGAHDFAHSILTTDIVTKEVAVAIEISGKEVRIGGASKGAGMVNPNMATTLMFITTDVAIDKKALKKAAKTALDNSLNVITIDGDMSPNDSLFIMANGEAKNKVIVANGPDFEKFSEALSYVCNKLAKLLVKDAEGAGKFVSIKVKKASTKKQAQIIACGIANSLLFKTMIHGGDPNWGRVVSAAGSADKKVNINKLDIYFGKNKVFGNGEPVKIDLEILRKTLIQDEIEIVLDLKSGEHEALKYTCDLSAEYVRINSKYTT